MNLADLALTVITTINSAQAAELQRADYEALLKGHDWQYDRADDHRVWTRGHYERQALRAMQQRLDPEFATWNRLAPPEFRIEDVPL